MHNTIGIRNLAVAGKSIQDKRETLIAFHIPWTFEVFIEYGAN